MTNHLVTSYVTTLDFPTLNAFDTVSVTALGGVIDLAAGITGGGGNSLHIAGTLQLGFITLKGEDVIRIAVGGSVYAPTYSAAISTGSVEGYSVVDNAGSITSGWGIGVDLSGSFDILRNAGQISGYVAVQIGAPSDTHQSLINSGEIYGAYQAVTVQGGMASIVNTGLIQSAQETAVNIAGEYNGTNSFATEQDMVNHGTITTASLYAIHVALNLSGSVFNLTNFGTIFAKSYAVISLGQSRDTVANTGTINGGIDLGGGDDRYDGQGGVLTRALFLGTGNDTADLRGGSVGDYVYGGAGSDVYYLSNSATVLIEGGDLDTDYVFAACDYRLAANIETLNLLDGGAYAGAGNASANRITGNASDNRLTGLDGLDTLLGDLGDDWVYGGNQNDDLGGGDGDDRLFGGAGLDTLRGGDGDDTLTGGAGRDSLTGDIGADVFVFATLAHMPAAPGTFDLVTDFVRGEDIIDLARIDARSTNAAPNDTFAFIGNAAFGGVAGQLRFAVFAGYVVVELDVNGDSSADAALRLNGLTAVGASDFVL